MAIYPLPPCSPNWYTLWKRGHLMDVPDAPDVFWRVERYYKVGNKWWIFDANNQVWVDVNPPRLHEHEDIVDYGTT